MKSYQLYESYKVGTERKSPPAVLQVSAHCIKIMLYFLSISATKPEVEGFRDQGFVLPEAESLRVQFVASYKSFTLKRGARHQFINCE